LPKTSAFRYLYTLRASGFVDYDDRTERYSIGPRVSVPLPLPAMAERIKAVSCPNFVFLRRNCPLFIRLDGLLAFNHRLGNSLFSCRVLITFRRGGRGMRESNDRKECNY
jgi:hypothetical protein